MAIAHEVSSISKKVIKPEKKKISKKRRELIIAYFFMVPTLVTLIIFIFGPIIFSFIMSLYENPSNDELRHAISYYFDFSNFSLASLWRFFVLNNEESGEFGVLMVDGIRIILIVIFVIIFIRKFYNYHKKKPEITSAKAYLFGMVLSFPLTLIIVGVIFTINPNLNLIALILGILSFIAFTFLIQKKIKEKNQINSKINGISSLIFGFVISPLVFVLLIWLLNGGLVIFQWLAVVIKLPIEEYRFVLTDSVQIDFLRVLFNTVFWTVVCTFLHITLGILLAILMNRDFVGKGFFRGIFILPWAIPSFVSTLIFRNFIFDNRQGFLGTRVRDIFYSTPFTYTYLNENSEIKYGWEFYLGDLFSLLIGITVIVIGIILFAKILKKMFKPKSILKPTLMFLIVLGLLPLGYYLFLGLSGFIRNQSWFMVSLIKLPEIKSTFWITDDVVLLDMQNQPLKMVTISAIILNTWLGVPFMMVSFLAALQNIPKELYEAAEIGGSSEWKKFKEITFPLIKPTLFTVSLLGFVWTFNLFNVVYLLTQGQTGLGDSKYYEIFVTYIYRLFSLDRWYSYAAAMSFVVFLMLITFSRVYNKVFDIEKMFVGDESKSSLEEELKMITLREYKDEKELEQNNKEIPNGEGGLNHEHK